MAHRLAPQARADLDEIWSYLFIQSGSETIADGQIDLITDRFLMLASWPRLGRTRNDLRRGLRSHPVGSWVIFYRIARSDVLILRVLHGRRDLGAILSRR
jgi:toxin ParE1/3/4